MSELDELSIELDCAPMSPRPDSYIGGVLEGTGLSVDDFEEPSKSFVNWTWTLKSEEKRQKFIDAKPTFEARIKSLHTRGHIRYGSW